MSEVKSTYVCLQNNGKTIVIHVSNNNVRYYSSNEHIWKVNSFNCVRCGGICTKNVFCNKDPTGWCDFIPIFL